MQKYVLGLDLGPTSIGWSAINISEEGEFRGFMALPDFQKDLIGLGVRHFQINIEKYGSGDSEKTKTRNRREMRGQRRTIRRKKGRKFRLLKFLQENGLAPKEKNELEELMKKDPYTLRERAIKEPLHLYEVGRILLHMAKRRGFKSNRKFQVEGEKKDSDFEKAKEELKKNLTGKTLGQFWHDKRISNSLEPIRNRSGNYKGIAQREDYINEIKQIWLKQELQPNFLNEIIKNNEEIDKDKLLFWQQTYKISHSKMQKIIGKCSLMPTELRCPYSNRKAQEFRMLQKVNDIIIIKNGIGNKLINDNDRLSLINELSLVDEMNIEDVRKILKLEDSEQLNFEYEGNKKIPGNEVDTQLKKLFDKKEVIHWPNEKREMVWNEILLYSERNDITEVQLKNNLEKYKIELKVDKLKNIRIPTENCKFSEKILDELLKLMRSGIAFNDAINTVCKNLDLRKPWRVLKQLPLPEEIGIDVTNPAVKNALYQVRKVLNSLISDLGKPDKIVIELARELKASKEHREEIIKKQKRNQDERDDVKKLICEINEWPKDRVNDIPEWQVERYRLWQQQKGRCVYSGKCISPQTQLFEKGVIEVDHILPYSISLDNSMNNKIVCFTEENKNKGQNSPSSWLENTDIEKWEKLRHSIAHWNPKEKEIAATIKPCPELKNDGKINYDKEKWHRFFIKNEEIQEKYQPGNLLSDTTHITTAVCEYLQRLYPLRAAKTKVATTKGGITAELRKIWGLNEILGSEENKKNRSDLRHHAIDAAVVAVTEPRIIRQVTSAVQKAWPERNYRRIKAPLPWNNFIGDLKDAVGELNISHKAEHKVSGALLDANAFGLTDEVKEEFQKGGMVKLSKNAWLCNKTMAYLRRRPITDAIKKVKDLQIIPKNAEKLNRVIIEKLRESKIDINNIDEKIPEEILKKVMFKDKKGMDIPIRNIQTLEKKGNMVVITDSFGIPYKAYPSGENHHLEIFKHKKEYICKIWTMIEMVNHLSGKSEFNATDGKKDSVIFRKHPKVRDAEFVMSLAKHDIVLIRDKNNKDRLARIESISQSKPGSLKNIYLELMPLEIADNKFLESKELKKEFRNDWLIQSLPVIERKLIRKVTIDPLGRIRWAEKKYWGKYIGKDM